MTEHLARLRKKLVLISAITRLSNAKIRPIRFDMPRILHLDPELVEGLDASALYRCALPIPPYSAKFTA